MLVSWEKHSYNIALSAAMGIPFDANNDVCPVCSGTGLLPNPTAYMSVAVCYVCRNGLVAKGSQPQLQPKQKKKKVHFDKRECCNVSTTTLSA